MIPTTHTIDDLWQGLEQTVAGWSRTLELAQYEPAGHAYRVAETSLLLARRLGLSLESQAHIVWGALLHDIGMLGVPQDIVVRRGPLTPNERALVEQHPLFARNLLAPIQVLERAIEIPYHHHERFDGKGYPQQLAGESIPLSARLFAVVDVFDVLSNDQPYRQAWDRDTILEHIESAKGTHFDPDIADQFLTMLQSSSEIDEVLVREPRVPTALSR